MGQEYSKKLPKTDRQNIRTSWRLIRERMNDLGFSFMQILYDCYPISHAIITNDRETLEKHGLRYMREISELVAGIDNPQRLNFIIQRLTKEHQICLSKPELTEGWSYSFIHMLKKDVYNDDDITNELFVKSWEVAIHLLINVMMSTSLKNGIQNNSEKSL